MFDLELEPLVDEAIREDEVWGFRVSKLREERKRFSIKTA